MHTGISSMKGVCGQGLCLELLLGSTAPRWAQSRGENEFGADLCDSHQDGRSFRAQKTSGKSQILGWWSSQSFVRDSRYWVLFLFQKITRADSGHKKVRPANKILQVIPGRMTWKRCFDGQFYTIIFIFVFVIAMKQVLWNKPSQWN